MGSLNPDAECKDAKISIPDIIARKRAGNQLSRQHIQKLIDGIVSGEVQESQIGAILMAIFLQGMSMEETSHLTRSMMLSGEVLTWPQEWHGLVADKHSTGGVGDKVSLPLAPALAACGIKVPMISGRGLGFTGGTLDKLESIPGYQVLQSTESMKDILTNVGCCIVGQTNTLVPADKTLYAIRDVTATVESIPLIAASIVSKKGAEGLSALILDVKTGKGAMIPDENSARELASTMVSVGNTLGVKVSAVLSSMNNPIGQTIGNALEIEETLQCLHGNGPDSLNELVTVLGGHLLFNLGKAPSAKDGANKILRTLQDGSALSKFCNMLKAQGVDTMTADKLCSPDTDVYTILPEAKHKTDLHVETSGYVSAIDALVCARVSFDHGAGRTKAGQPVDHAVGLQLHVSIGQEMKAGDVWITVHHNRDLSTDDKDVLTKALTVSADSVTRTSLIMDIFT